MEMTLAHALRYASMGWSVLPLHHVLASGRCSCGSDHADTPNSIGKHPYSDLVPHGVHDASKDSARITEWFTRAPNANIGVATGAPSGFDALDVDPRNGGDDILSAAEVKHGKLPDTAVQLTGGNGYHYLFAFDPAARLKSPGKGIDVKSTGGYIVVEPSNHVSGGHYAWEGSADPTEGHPISAAPKFLLQPVVTGLQWGKKQAAVGYLDPIRIADLRSAMACLDCSNYHVWIGVGQALHSTDAPEAFEIWDTWSQGAKNYANTAQKWGTFKNDGGLHVESIFAWARDAGWRNVSTGKSEVGDSSIVATIVPLRRVIVPHARDNTTPSHLLRLPGALGTFVDLTNRTAPKPQPQFAVQAALALGATVLGRHYRTTKNNYPSLYFVNVGKSASGKEHPRTVIEAVLTAAGMSHMMGSAGYKSDSAVFSALMHQPAQLAIIDELGSMLGNTKAQGNFHKRQAIDMLVQAWGLLHGTLRLDASSTIGMNADQRAEYAKRLVQRPALSLLGMTTPRTFYDSLSEQSIEGGFLNRLIIVESHVGRSLSRDCDPLEVPDSLAEWCKAARDAVGGNLSGVSLGHDIAPMPRVVEFTPEANAALRVYEAEIIEEMNQLEKDGLDEMQGRSREKAMRIALILAVSDNVSTPRITAEHVLWAIDYVRYYTAQTIAAIQRHMHGSQFGQWCQTVLEAVQFGGLKGRTERELATYCRTFRGLEPRQRASVLTALLENGQVLRVKSGRRVSWVAGVESESEADSGEVQVFDSQGDSP